MSTQNERSRSAAYDRPSAIDSSTATDPSTSNDPSTSIDSSTATDPSTSIDMVGPAQACHMLELDHGELLALARSGGLAAYDLGGHIRFRYRDVASLASRRAIAA